MLVVTLVIFVADFPCIVNTIRHILCVQCVCVYCIICNVGACVRTRALEYLETKKKTVQLAKNNIHLFSVRSAVTLYRRIGEEFQNRRHRKRRRYNSYGCLVFFIRISSLAAAVCVCVSDDRLLVWRLRTSFLFSAHIIRTISRNSSRQRLFFSSRR